MCKSLIVGDIHSKARFILPLLDNVIKKYNVEKVYFLGDYVDEWDTNETEVLADLEFLVDWNNKSGTVNSFVIGNHDVAYFFPNFMCTGHNYGIEEQLMNLLWNSLHVKFSDVLEKEYLLTHAGINDYWFSTNFLTAYAKTLNVSDPTEVSDYMNQLFTAEVTTMFNKGELYDPSTMNKMFRSLNEVSRDRGGFSPTGGPLWCDKSEMEFRPCTKFNQIVGHTPVNTCQLIEAGDKEVWFIDTFSNYLFMLPDGKKVIRPIGDYSILLFNEGVNKIFIN